MDYLQLEMMTEPQKTELLNVVDKHVMFSQTVKLKKLIVLFHCNIIVFKLSC